MLSASSTSYALSCILLNVKLGPCLCAYVRVFVCVRDREIIYEVNHLCLSTAFSGLFSVLHCDWLARLAS